MRTFTVEGNHWLKDIEIDNSLFDSYDDMCFEAMTQAVEGFFIGEYEEEFDGEPSLSMYMVGYERGCGTLKHKRSMALTEFILYNAGYHAVAHEFRRLAIEELKKENKKKKKD